MLWTCVGSFDYRSTLPVDGSVIEIATPADIEEIESLVNRAFRGETGRRGWTTESHLLDGQRIDQERLRESLQNVDTRLLVHRERLRMRACVELRSVNVGVVYLGMLSVDPEAQSQGLGGRILAAAERFAVDFWQARQIEMTVLSARPELISWYERRGYVVTGERRPFPYGNPRFGLPRTETLEFLVLAKAFRGLGEEVLRS